MSLPSRRRHDLDPALVQKQVQKRLNELSRKKAERLVHARSARLAYEKALAQGNAHRWTRKPPEEEEAGRIYDEMVQWERTYYARVRVIELPQEGKRFILVYGDTDDATVQSGTGPFETLDEAASWFMSGGR